MSEPWVGWVRGLCSGFPPCCVRFWVEQYEPAAPKFGYAFSDPTMAAHYQASPKGLGYIPCPECLAAGRFVETTPCALHCAALAVLPEASGCPTRAGSL